MWTHRDRVAEAVAAPAAPAVTQGTPTDQTYDEVRDAQQAVTLAGPLANYMARQKPSDIETLDPIKPAQPAQAVQTAAPAIASNGRSPIEWETRRWAPARDFCTRRLELRKSCSWPFEVPAHAPNPQLRGNIPVVS